jgi:hypothetical protein
LASRCPSEKLFFFLVVFDAVELSVAIAVIVDCFVNSSSVAAKMQAIGVGGGNFA